MFNPEVGKTYQVRSKTTGTVYTVKILQTAGAVPGLFMVDMTSYLGSASNVPFDAAGYELTCTLPEAGKMYVRNNKGQIHSILVTEVSNGYYTFNRIDEPLSARNGSIDNLYMGKITLTLITNEQPKQKLVCECGSWTVYKNTGKEYHAHYCPMSKESA